MLSKLFSKKQQGVIGYLYVADCEQGILSNASEGMALKNKKPGPPWIVVDHDINAMVVAKWPGTLWEAQVIDEAKNTGLREGAKYTRANGVKVLRKLPLSVLFGERGDGILKIIDTVKTLDLVSAQTLSNNYTNDASVLYSKGWNIFGGTKDGSSPTYGRDHRNTIAMPGDEGCSPINNGFKIIYGKVFDLAKAIKKVIALQITDLMQKQNLSKTAMAKRMKTGRSSIDRLLDPQNESVTLQTLERAALILGKRLQINFISV